ncbi:MAG: hypothetical protein WDO73_29045 [Ignavibacteriota bacterium]
MYQRQRKGWGFNGGGPGSGIYRTVDGGATWTEMSNGLPHGDKGRIGIATAARDGQTVYAIVEADPPGAGGVYRSTTRGDRWEHLASLNPRPMYYSRIYLDPKDSNRVYLMGSNRGLWISDDAGRSLPRHLQRGPRRRPHFVGRSGEYQSPDCRRRWRRLHFVRPWDVVVVPDESATRPVL